MEISQYFWGKSKNGCSNKQKKNPISPAYLRGFTVVIFLPSKLPPWILTPVHSITYIILVIPGHGRGDCPLIWNPQIKIHRLYCTTLSYFWDFKTPCVPRKNLWFLIVLLSSKSLSLENIIHGHSKRQNGKSDICRLTSANHNGKTANTVNINSM